jgi:hypothetical protein
LIRYSYSWSRSCADLFLAGGWCLKNHSTCVSLLSHDTERTPSDGYVQIYLPRKKPGLRAGYGRELGKLTCLHCSLPIDRGPRCCACISEQVADLEQRHASTSSKTSLCNSSRRSTTCRRIRSQRPGHPRKKWPVFGAHLSFRRPTSLVPKLRSSYRSRNRHSPLKTRYRMALATPSMPDRPRSQAIATVGKARRCSLGWEACNEMATHHSVATNLRLPCRGR